MSMFTLAISCLTTSNLLWFMDLESQVPMQYCSLQHWTFLPSPVTSTIGCCFCFGSVSSFFLELFLHCSPVAYWAPTDLGSSSFNVLSFCLFHTVHGVLKIIILKWFAIAFYIQTERLPKGKEWKSSHPDMNQNGFRFLSSKFLCHNDWLHCSNPVSLLLPLLLFGSTQSAP